MAEDTPESPKKPAPKLAKPVNKAATSTTPGAKPHNVAAAKSAAKPKPAKPLKGPIVDTNTTSDTKPVNVQMLKDGAAKVTRDVGDKARGYVEEGKTRAGGALDELSKMMTDAAGSVDEKLGAQYGDYARSAADAVSGFSESLKAKEIDDLIADARGFVKKSPAIAIGTAAAVGFVLMRLIKSGLDAADRTTDGKA